MFQIFTFTYWSWINFKGNSAFISKDLIMQSLSFWVMYGTNFRDVMDTAFLIIGWLCGCDLWCLPDNEGTKLV